VITTTRPASGSAWSIRSDVDMSVIAPHRIVQLKSRQLADTLRP
jgi:hypothetical protein